MDQCDEWQQKIEDGHGDSVLKTEIASRILHLLTEKKNSLDEWEKVYFAQAITALSINVNSLYLPTEAGLILCLNALRTAMIEKSARDEAKMISYSGRELISHAKLVATVRNIRGQIV